MSVVKGKRKENDLQVIKELRELASHTIKCCGNESVFPKSKRWLYTQRITNEAIDALSCAVRANSIRVSEGDEDTCRQSMQSYMANARRGDSYFVRSKVAKYYRDLSGDRYHDYVKRRKKTCGARI